MRTIAALVGCLALSIAYTASSLAGGQSQEASAASARRPANEGDELHFVSMLTLRGEVVAINLPNRLITIRDPNGHSSKLEVRSERDLEPLKVGDRVVAHYFEGAQINKKPLRGAIPAASLNDGMTGAEFGGHVNKGHGLVAAVEDVDAAEQELTVKGGDGSVETIMVANPEYLKYIKVGDRVEITGAEAL